MSFDLPQFEPVLDLFAECDRCELKHQKNSKQTCFGLRPTKPFNGIMIIGEGPGRNEVVKGRPFVGASGELLRALCDAEGLDMDACYITNATLCRPPASNEKGPFTTRFPEAVHACIHRLEEEIARVKPRVILGFGVAAMAALTGAEEQYTKREPLTCTHCNPTDRKVSGIMCPIGDCKHIWEGVPLPPVKLLQKDGTTVEVVPVSDEQPKDCPKCGASWKRVKIRRVKCPACGSRKLQDVQKVKFDWDYNLNELAGLVIDTNKENDWHLAGVRYIICTFHPSFLLQGTSEGSGEKKVMAGQFAAKAVQRHIRKALYLSQHDVDWNLEYEFTNGDDDTDAADHLFEYVYNGWQDEDKLAVKQARWDEEFAQANGDKSAIGERPTGVCPYNFTLDVETEAFGTIYECTECNKKTDNVVAAPPETQPVLEAGWCSSDQCGKYTRQIPKEGELDARVLEYVSKIKVIGFHDRLRGFALVVDTRNPGPRLMDMLKRVLEDERVRKTMQNGGYDHPVIRKLWGIKVASYTDDTLSMHHVLCPDETHTLAHLAARYTYARAWKPPKSLKGHAAHETFAELVQYNARDVVVTSDARNAMESELLRKGNAHNVYKLDMKLMTQALDMQWNGMAIDYDAACKVGETYKEERDDALSRLRVAANDERFNPNSPEQLNHLLFERLGFPVTVWTDGGKSGIKKPSTATNVIVTLPDCDVKRALLDFKNTEKTLRSYFDTKRGKVVPGAGMRVWADGRIHAAWKPFGTRTGRFTSSPNFQNWPKWMRSMVVAPKGRRIVGADYDQLELRVMAGLSNDATLIDKCMNADDARKLEPDCDPHSFVAQISFGVLYTNLLLKDPAHDKSNAKCKCQTCQRKALRDLCKRVIYGLNYGAGDAKVLESIFEGGYNGPPLNLEMIGRIRSSIFKAFPGIERWRDQQLIDAARDQAVFSPIMKRWRTFPLGDIPPTKAWNFPIQSAGGDIVNIRNTLFYEKYMHQIDPTALYLAQVHDAVYYEVADEAGDEFEDALTEALTYTTELVPGGTKICYSAKASHSDNWKDAA
jgi:uracil-DNA glycosylase family 4